MQPKDPHGSPASLASERGWMRQRARRMIGPNLRRYVDSEDLVQQVQLEAVRQLDGRTFDSPSAFRKWLGLLLRHRAIEVARRRRLTDSDASGSSVSDPVRGPATQCADRDDARALLVRLGELPDRDRRVVTLRVLEGLPFAEVARRLGLSEVHARVVFNRTLARLRARPGSA
ncbi:MAG: sigma-70 family RNA polymerase sigma factor [Planctomycetota bacterium]